MVIADFGRNDHREDEPNSNSGCYNKNSCKSDFRFLIRQNYTVVKKYLSRLNLFYDVLTNRKVVNSQRRYRTDIISIC